MRHLINNDGTPFETAELQALRNEIDAKEFDEKGRTAIMEEIVGRALTNSYHKRLAYLEGKQIITLSDYAKENRISHSNLINKATRQTIETFLEKNIWKIGV